LHPLESAAFSRRTPKIDIRVIEIPQRNQAPAAPLTVGGNAGAPIKIATPINQRTKENKIPFLRILISWEFPRFCRGGSSSLTFPALVLC
jgi:hypothetical protein